MQMITNQQLEKLKMWRGVMTALGAENEVDPQQ